jgi:hypothetical protein
MERAREILRSLLSTKEPFEDRDQAQKLLDKLRS